MPAKSAPKTTAKATVSGTSDGDSFMIFIIGLLCGLTVVISSLAIYNFLSHETTKTASLAKTDAHADEKPAAPADKQGEADKPEVPAQDKSH
jgi:hypothetical protein